MKKKINKAVSKFYRLNAFLLTEVLNINERSLVFHFAICLKEQFPNYDIDVEYNRNVENIHNGKVSYTKGDYWKKVINIDNYEKGYISDEDIDGKTVFPDIILHKRGTKNNYCILEIKKKWSYTKNSRAKDITKLQKYKRDLHYKKAIFIAFSENIKDIDIEFV
jgi:hypothetical protein